jgi:hypothetical protein
VFNGATFASANREGCSCSTAIVEVMMMFGTDADARRNAIEVVEIIIVVRLDRCVGGFNDGAFCWRLRQRHRRRRRRAAVMVFTVVRVSRFMFVT